MRSALAVSRRSANLAARSPVKSEGGPFVLRIIIAGPVLAAGKAARRSSIHTTAAPSHTTAGSADISPGASAMSSIADRTSGYTGSPTAHCIASRRQTRRAPPRRPSEDRKRPAARARGHPSRNKQPLRLLGPNKQVEGSAFFCSCPRRQAAEASDKVPLTDERILQISFASATPRAADRQAHAPRSPIRSVQSQRLTDSFGSCAASGFSGASARGSGSQGFGPGLRIPAEAARRLSGLPLFGPNLNLVDSVMIKAVAARRSRSCSAARRLRFIKVRAATTCAQ